MSLIPFIMMGKASKNADGEGLAMLLSSPLIATIKIGEKFESVKDAIVARAQIRANKKEFETIKEDYAKLSEGKIGTIETYNNEEDNSITTVIHTENGPFTKIERAGNVVLSNDGKATTNGKSVSYSGLREVTDSLGNTSLAFINNVTLKTSEPFENFNRDEIIAYNTEGTMLTENGLKSDYTKFTNIHKEEPTPTSGAFDVIEGLEADFSAEFAKINALNNTTFMDPGITPEA